MKELVDRDTYTELIWDLWDDYVHTYLSLWAYFEKANDETVHDKSNAGLKEVCEPGLVNMERYIEEIETTPAATDCIDLQLQLLKLIRETHDIFHKLTEDIDEDDKHLLRIVETYFYLFPELEKFQKNVERVLPEV